uniref:Wsv295-like protein n=1 Tax=Sicyonia whispovirus TaxID=2984283 RepID=A0A9C7C9D3_9VIRU|nr:MAG: wsv295-like protein [Sicyonia whispovirus]
MNLRNRRLPGPSSPLSAWTPIEQDEPALAEEMDTKPLELTSHEDFSFEPGDARDDTESGLETDTGSDVYDESGDFLEKVSHMTPTPLGRFHAAVIEMSEERRKAAAAALVVGEAPECRNGRLGDLSDSDSDAEDEKDDEKCAATSCCRPKGLFSALAKGFCSALAAIINCVRSKLTRRQVFLLAGAAVAAIFNTRNVAFDERSAAGPVVSVPSSPAFNDSLIGSTGADIPLAGDTVAEIGNSLLGELVGDAVEHFISAGEGDSVDISPSSSVSVSVSSASDSSEISN